ncbi:MAG: cytochrome b [Rhodospirillales bacterium]|nr:cytochrome b [Rhodospirillales bacterium]
MQVANTREGWGAVQQALYWTIGLTVLGQLCVGLIFSNLPENDPAAGTYFGIHGTLGVLIFTAMLFRLVWRQMHPVPALPDTLSPSLKLVARGTHWAFYVLLIGLPLGGWLMVNARGYRVSFFGLELPALIAKNQPLAEIVFKFHAGGAFLLAGLIVLHVGAALRHEFLLKDNTLRRMTPLPPRTDPLVQSTAFTGSRSTWSDNRRSDEKSRGRL